MIFPFMQPLQYRHTIKYLSLLNTYFYFSLLLGTRSRESHTQFLLQPQGSHPEYGQCCPNSRPDICSQSCVSSLAYLMSKVGVFLVLFVVFMFLFFFHFYLYLVLITLVLFINRWRRHKLKIIKYNRMAAYIAIKTAHIQARHAQIHLAMFHRE